MHRVLREKFKQIEDILHRGIERQEMKAELGYLFEEDSQYNQRQNTDFTTLFQIFEDSPEALYEVPMPFTQDWMIKVRQELFEDMDLNIYYHMARASVIKSIMRVDAKRSLQPNHFISYLYWVLRRDLSIVKSTLSLVESPSEVELNQVVRGLLTYECSSDLSEELMDIDRRFIDELKINEDDQWLTDDLQIYFYRKSFYSEGYLTKNWIGEIPNIDWGLTEVHPLSMNKTFVDDGYSIKAYCQDIQKWNHHGKELVAYVEFVVRKRLNYFAKGV